MGGELIYRLVWILTRWGLHFWRSMYSELPPLFLPFLYQVCFSYQVCQMLDLAVLMVALLVVLGSGLGHTFGARVGWGNFAGDILWVHAMDPGAWTVMVMDWGWFSE